MEVTSDDHEVIARIAALDIGKAELVCCARIPGPVSGSGRKRVPRMQEVRTYSTMTSSLAGMADWLSGLGVTRVVMEATSDYWKPPFYLLEAAGFEVWLVNARDVKHLPGRPKTDTLDAVWLCKGRRTADDPGQFRASTPDPDPAGPDPVPVGPGRGPHE
jgi:transposase